MDQLNPSRAHCALHRDRDELATGRCKPLDRRPIDVWRLVVPRRVRRRGRRFAAVVVALMYAGGQLLEAFAERRAGREMTALLSRVPRTVMRYRDGALEEVDIDSIVAGDRMLIRRGDVAPVDGIVAAGSAILDQAHLTGEALPARTGIGGPVMSGLTNVGNAFDLTAAHRAREITYAGIVRLVEAAQRSKAPMSRLADQFAAAFLGLTIAIAGAAWLWSRGSHSADRGAGRCYTLPAHPCRAPGQSCRDCHAGHDPGCSSREAGPWR